MSIKTLLYNFRALIVKQTFNKTANLTRQVNLTLCIPQQTWTGHTWTGGVFPLLLMYKSVFIDKVYEVAPMLSDSDTQQMNTHAM